MRHGYLPPYNEAGEVARWELRRLERLAQQQLDAALLSYHTSGYEAKFRPVVHHFAQKWLTARAHLAQAALDEVIR